MNNAIQTMLLQLRTLRKCGISTIFAPGVLQNETARREWCVKAVALLSGYDMDDFDQDEWKRVLEVVCAGNLTLTGTDEFTKDERERFQPLLRAAEGLFEVTCAQSEELAGRTINA